MYPFAIKKGKRGQLHQDGPSLSKRKEVSPSLQARRPFMHRGDTYPFLINIGCSYIGVYRDVSGYIGESLYIVAYRDI